MRLVLKRLASVVCLMAFAQSTWAPCAGWQATPEARRQCCESGACPLHHRDKQPSRTQLTQAAADDCCAESQQQQSNPSGTPFAPTVTLAVVQSVPPVVLDLAPARLAAPAETASPPAHVPKHVLLSVFLV